MLNTTSKKLYFLITIFIIGFLSLVSVNIFFVSLMNNLDKKTTNYEAKIQIGEFIAEDILKVKSLFFELATATTSNRARKLVKSKIKEVLQDMENSLEVLEKGGTLKRVINLNVTGHSSLIKEIQYISNKNNIPLAVIDVKPKLIDFKEMVQTADNFLEQRYKAKKAKDTKKFMKIAKKIKRFYKVTPAFFSRMTENIRRLLYESDIELQNIKLEIQNQKTIYMNMKISLIILVIFLVVAIGYWISRIINNDNKKLIKLNLELEQKELSIKAILNGQTNIVAVTNGIEMIDANEAIANFFDQFNDVEEFKKTHECICDFFLPNPSDNTYLEKKYYDGLNWLEYILANPTINFKVIMNNGRANHHFSVSANKKDIDGNNNYIIVVSLTDITSEINSQKELAKLNHNLETIVENKTRELKDLNDNLEQKIIIETQKVREKDKQITQQSRFAALGEMIGNIAHQWRQPLSAINTTASGMQVQMQLGLTSDDEVQESYTKIMGYVDFLNQTIEDFRGFFKEDKEKVDFNMKEVLKKTLSITGASYKDNNIELINTCENDEIAFISNGMPSELSQVFLNILNNAKDALVEHKQEDMRVYVSAKIENNFNVIYIQDDAGGIPDKIIDKIFDPYFTTKHQSQGTGIGLYMSKDIVEKHMNGQLTVENKNIILDNQEYNGARFRIAIPIKS